MVPVVMSAWYMAAFSGAASIGVPSRLIRPVASSAMLVATLSLAVTSDSFWAMTVFEVRTRLRRASSLAVTNMAYWGCGSQAEDASVPVSSPMSGIFQTSCPSTGFTVGDATPGMAL